MILKKIWYECFKIFLRINLHFYSKEIKIQGKENIPKKGAVLFAANHPNALMDPLYIAAFNPKEIHFLVRADVFKNSLLKKVFATLNLMPIYRMRDGRSSLSNNQQIFEKCYQILNNEKSLLIFPQGGHSRDRSIPNLSKGFTRILFGALDLNPELEIHLVPVGITYQNSSQSPSRVAVNYGNPIHVNQSITNFELKEATENLKNEVQNQLKQLSVHIPMDAHYSTTLKMLNNANVNFTNVNEVNELITNQQVLNTRKKRKSLIDILYLPIILNNFVPFLVWKIVSKRIVQIEFVDTFRFGIGLLLTPTFLVLQAIGIGHFTSEKIGIIYFLTSVVIILVYSKNASTPAEN